MNNKYILLLLLGLPMACHNAPLDPDAEVTEIQEISFKVPELEGSDLETKTQYEATSGGYVFNWSEGDIVGIISGAGSQLKFPIKEEFYGEKIADFDGGGFALLPNTTYSSYYPFISDYNLDPAAIPVSYEGQKSVGSNDLSHMGEYSYWVAQGQSPSSGILYFSFLNVGSPHLYRFPALPADYAQLTVKIPESKYIVEGTLNIFADDQESLIAITPTRMSDQISIDLTGTTMSSAERIWCWMMMPPANLDGDVISLILTLSDGSQILSSVPGRDCPANYRRVFNGLTSVYPAESRVPSDGGTVEIKLIRTAATDAVTYVINDSWLTETGSSTDGLVTTYSFTADGNTGAERVGSISFTETSTSLTNTVKITQDKAGTIIGIGGWETESHSGTAN